MRPLHDTFPASPCPAPSLLNKWVPISVDPTVNKGLTYFNHGPHFLKQIGNFEVSLSEPGTPGVSAFFAQDELREATQPNLAKEPGA